VHAFGEPASKNDSNVERTACTALDPGSCRCELFGLNDR